MLKQLVNPLWRHDHAPLTVLEVLLALVTIFTGLIDHALYFVRVKRVEHLKEEVAFG